MKKKFVWTNDNIVLGKKIFTCDWKLGGVILTGNTYRICQLSYIDQKSNKDLAIVDEDGRVGRPMDIEEMVNHLNEQGFVPKKPLK